MNAWFIWEIIVNSIEIGLIYYFLSHKLELKKSFNVKRTAVLGAILLIATRSVLDYLNINIYWNDFNLDIYFTRLLFVLSVTIYSFAVFEGSAATKLLCGFFTMIVSIVADYITGAIGASSGIDVSLVYQFNNLRFPLTIVYLLILTATYFLFANLSYKNKKSKEERYLPWYMVLVLVATLITSTMAIDQLMYLSFVADTMGQVVVADKLLFISFSFFVFLVALFVYIDNIGRVFNKNLNIALDLQKAKNERESYIGIEATIESFRDARHDMKNHVAIMNILLKKQNLKELEEYFQKMSDEVLPFCDIVLTSNATINALLATKMNQARALNVEVVSEVKGDISKNIDCFDICSIIGNLLDNAIEATKKVTKTDTRHVEFTMKSTDKMISIFVSNNTDGAVVKKGDTLVTTKKRTDVNMHGYGIKRINRIISGYKGHFNLIHKNNHFLAIALIPVNEL